MPCWVVYCIISEPDWPSGLAKIGLAFEGILVIIYMHFLELIKKVNFINTMSDVKPSLKKEPSTYPSILLLFGAQQNFPLHLNKNL